MTLFTPLHPAIHTIPPCDVSGSHPVYMAPLCVQHTTPNALLTTPWCFVVEIQWSVDDPLMELQALPNALHRTPLWSSNEIARRWGHHEHFTRKYLPLFTGPPAALPGNPNPVHMTPCCTYRQIHQGAQNYHLPLTGVPGAVHGIGNP